MNMQRDNRQKLQARAEPAKKSPQDVLRMIVKI